MSGVTTMKMMSRTSMTSTIGVTLMSAITFVSLTSCSNEASSGALARPGGGAGRRSRRLRSFSPGGRLLSAARHAHARPLLLPHDLVLVAQQEVHELLRGVG